MVSWAYADLIALRSAHGYLQYVQEGICGSLDRPGAA
jgi:hypothetical protein